MNREVIENAIKVLNEMLETDHDALLQLMNFRVSCSKELANHPTIQVRAYGKHFSETGEYTVSVLGLLNGLFGKDPETEYGYITIIVDYDSELEKIKHISGFTLTDLDRIKHLSKGKA